MNYEQDIVIDESALDIECLEQPKLMMKYARHAAETQAEADRLKEQLDLIKAQIDDSVRQNPDKYDIEKITEAVVLNKILQEKQYQEALKEYLEAKFESNIAKNAITAFEQRKNMLEALIKLHGQQYFAGPRVPRDIAWERKEYKERREKINAGIANKMIRRRSNDN